ncbi:hypothetical protein [Streptomyces griseomycini]|uniref:Uncharacterized protein n=1 Tax=Streptomyces griseomycini TaxID=66895 RepID=A0A7W7VA47_9ACTN|nr:hypothetical protein [Streptomyces griseomycini]MBB4902580.1 hypothetical protein [Streptomyces griseomycini]GGR54291.1 hypothetical protein GCM10015536_69510 [Streptomyces griseomycini]
MTPPTAAPARPDSPAVTLAEHVAALLPARAGVPWTVEPYAPWWTARHPAARIVQGERAVILVTRPWETEVGWQLPGREPYRPDFTLHALAPAKVAREVLRLVLPVIDDEAAARAHEDDDPARARLALLYEIGAAMRAQGAATYERGGLLRNTSTVTWSSSGCRYSATLNGSNPVADVQIEGPVRAVERAVAHFLPARPTDPKTWPMKAVRGRLQRRVAAFLAQRVDVEQTEQGGVAFGSGSGPYGYVAPPLDPYARVRDTSPASADVHGVGVDLLVSLAPQLAR